MKQGEYQSIWNVGFNQRDNVVEWNAGVDAVTVIGQNHHAALPFYNEYDNVRVRLGIAHAPDRPWSMHGYRGKQCGPVRVGLKDEKCILAVTGSESARVFEVSKRYTVKYTRIDLQVTLKLETPIRSWAYDHYHNPILTARAERGKIYASLIQSPDGDTMYLNKRTSPTYARMYDKSSEYMGSRGQYWRFEVEAKEEHSDRLGRILENLTEYTEIAADYVAGWYGDRDICVPLGTRDKLVIPEMPSGVSGFQETLAWMRRQVKPSLEILQQAGLLKEAEESLGVQLTFPEHSIDTEDL